MTTTASSNTAQVSGYAGDVSAAEAWDVLAKNPAAQMIDVRTTAEWSFVGLADLSPLGRRLHLVEWVRFPAMEPNVAFLAELEAAIGGDQSIPVFFLCRSGARSRAAAILATGAGYKNCFNVAGGFEGDLDASGQRGKTNGWKAAGLPWKQS